ncbi:OmpA family protein [Foetidibacter luteolus]|uniref:OmpA family protein n=1 Tax=Foetidibacter luteolus TaxID=2608880 RepID=UPI00129BA270|nr:OmpA family protein [Foetidibacter luteolus]
MSKGYAFYSILLVLVLQANTSYSQSTPAPFPDLPEIHFKGRSTRLNERTKVALDSAAKIAAQYPEYNISVCSASSGCGQSDGAISWDRVLAVIKYLVKKGVSEERFVFSYNGSGSPLVVILRFTTETGPPVAPVPRPVKTKTSIVRNATL